VSGLYVANNDDTKPLPEPRAILLRGGEIKENLDEIERGLIEQQVGVFQRNGGLVRPGVVSIDVRDGGRVKSVGLIDVCAKSLIEIITNATVLARYDRRTRQPVEVNCPINIAEAYMNRKGHWELRPLTGITNAPTLRFDGSVLNQPGYDPDTGLLYIPQRDVKFPAIPEDPTREHALKALSVLEELISAYPFVSPEAHSVALAAMLTGMIRRILPTAPGFAFTSPVPGSGKGLLCDTIAYLTHGRQPSSLTQGNEEETEKRISSALMRGDPVIVIDNITRPIIGDKLLSILTQQIADLRPLGSSKLVGHDTRALLLFNGNNLVIPGDMCRRLLVCGIDPGCENPEGRRFEFDPLERVKRNRGKYVSAGLTILGAYFSKRRPKTAAAIYDGTVSDEADPLGSYVDWSRWVRDALLWLGEPDPVKTIESSKSLDPEAEQIGAVFYHWAEVIGVGVRTTVKDAIAKATRNKGLLEDPDEFEEGPSDDTADKGQSLLDAFNAVAAPMTRGSRSERVDPMRLGKWLSKIKDRVVDGRRMVLMPEKRHGDRQWCLERVG